MNNLYLKGWRVYNPSPPSPHLSADSIHILVTSVKYQNMANNVLYIRHEKEN